MDATPGITDEELLARAVRCCRKSRRYHTRAEAVMHTFVLGSTYARDLCRRFGLDPDDRVR